MTTPGNRRRSVFAEVLADAQRADESPPPLSQVSEAPRPAQVFAQRKLQGMTEAAKMTKKPIIRLKPDECSVWDGNARDYGCLSEDALRPLIQSILAQGGNSIPAVVRRTPEGEKPYQVVVGTRRHWAINWLNNNHYPEIDLIAVVDDLDDEAAFRIADVENREREDISDLERAINYKQAIATYYGGVAQRMAERLSLPKSRLSELLLLAELPAEVVSAYARPADIKIHHAAKLAPLLRAHTTKELVLAAAIELKDEQKRRMDAGEGPLEPAQVLNRLLSSVSIPKVPKQRPTVTHQNGVQVATIIKDQARDGITLTIKPSKKLSVDEILAALRPVLESAKFQKKA
jgi:ParB family chromosome partitioning protein